MKYDVTPKEFYHSRNSVLISPAGCGKTDMIGQCVKLCNDGRQLILTHTHAGVRSILDKLKKYDVSSKFYSVQTIAGFCLKYSNAYPATGSLNIIDSENKINYDNVYKSTDKIIKNGFAEDIIKNSYTGVFVDEYQDCTVNQNNVILDLAKIIPTRILGDPLQGIFDFGNNEIVDFEKHVYNNFPNKYKLNYPWRWKNKNEKLGEWLLKIRELFIEKKIIDLTSRPTGVEWYEYTEDYSTQREKCYNSLKDNTYSITAICKMPNQAHHFCRQLGHPFTSMEEMEFKTLFEYCRKFDKLESTELALEIVKFFEICKSGISKELKTLKAKLKTNNKKIKKTFKHAELFAYFLTLIDNKSFKLINLIFLEILKGTDGHIYRKELMSEMLSVLSESTRDSANSLEEIAKYKIDIQKRLGRKIFRRSVSRILLIKGLEFDHTLIINGDDLSYKELYVALTRPCRRLTIFSKSETIIPTY